MYEFTKLQLCQKEFNNLLFMNPPKEWKKEECSELPFEESHEFLFNLCAKPLKEVVERIRERSGLKGPNQDPTKVFESLRDINVLPSVF